MATRRRWIQFSLRSFIVVLTIGCVWLGWKVDRARKRGVAIQALQKRGCSVFYHDGTDEAVLYNRLNPHPTDDQFWLDVKGVPVEIQLPGFLDVEVGRQLSHIYGTDTINIWLATDDDLQFLESTDARVIKFVHQEVTTRAKEALQAALPNCEIIP